MTAAQRSLAVRLLLVPVFVVICYFSDWWWLRIATTSVLIHLGAALGAPMHRLAPDLVDLDGMRIQFIVPCTMVDAFFGAIPLLWSWAPSWHRNLVRLSALFAGVFLLNITRLELGFIALHRGVPWWLAHECVAGVAYFCLFLWIVREHAWDAATRPLPALATPAAAPARA